MMGEKSGYLWKKKQSTLNEKAFSMNEGHVLRLHTNATAEDHNTKCGVDSWCSEMGKTYDIRSQLVGCHPQTDILQW